MRNGKILGRDSFFLDDEKGNPQQKSSLLSLGNIIRKSIGPQGNHYVKRPFDKDRALLSQWLTEKNEKNVTILVPQRGIKHDLILMAEENAKKNLDERLRKGRLALKPAEEAAEDLAHAIGMTGPLERMDCFDISHNQGAETVASMVVFRNGSPSKKDYRRYKLRSTEGKPDDFKSMQEVVYRRYKDAEDIPSLIIIDGGKGQLSSALEVIRGVGLGDVRVIGLAKREEEIFTEGAHESILLDKSSAALHLIQHIRDEAHRFAITYHRKRLAKRNLVSVLDHIEGLALNGGLLSGSGLLLWKRCGKQVLMILKQFLP
ncbi:hypothetical protein M5E89_02615 [Acidaminococcus intestini]|nr:hypothetical protein M5E89_02615 [Acidaminococcus intestini]